MRTISLSSASDAVIESNSPINTWQAVVIFFALVIVIVIFSLVKKIYYKYKYNKRYFIIPRVSVRGLSYISMVIAVSVSAIIIIAVVTSGAANALFRAFPGSRVAVESVLIKIGGLLFGPLLGLFIGAAVDFLAVALSGGVFHYGYLISAMAFGVLSGLVKTIIIYSNGKDLKFAISSSLVVILIGVGIACVVQFTPSIQDVTKISFFAIDLSVKKIQLISIISVLFAVVLCAIWVTFFISKYSKKFKKLFSFLVPVVVIVSVSEVLINILLLPVFDAEITKQSYWFWFGSRFISLPIVTLFNVIVLFSVYRIVGPLVKYDYTQDLVQDIDKSRQRVKRVKKFNRI